MLYRKLAMFSLAVLAALRVAGLFMAGAAIGADSGFWKSPAKLEPALLNELKRDEEKLDIYCLRLAYPSIKGVQSGNEGSKWLVTDSGVRILYSHAMPRANARPDDDSTPVAKTMSEPYSLEPARPDLPKGFSPGRKRNKSLLESLYGNRAKIVGERVRENKLKGKSLSLSYEASKALEAAIPQLEHLLKKKPYLEPYLEPGGGFCWRKIAGENRLSPHSYGIALDIGVDVAPYWRWSNASPHPKQKTYPGEIVKIMEDHGFIWGGKWHEYDLMHFEYRPELICKAKVRQMF